MISKKLYLLALPTIIALFVSWYTRTPKGIRNNNPLNIRGNDNFKWQGEIDRDFDGFVIFDTPENGFRAAGRVLRTYRDKHNLRTIYDIVNRWAPPNENDTTAYINSMVQKTGIGANTELEDVEQYAALVAAMTHHENGQNPFEITFIKLNVERGLV